MDTRAFHSHACSYGVDAVVVGFHRHLGAFARGAHHILNGNQTVEYFRHFVLEQPLQEYRGGTRQHDVRVGVPHFHADDHRPHRVAFLEEVGRYLFLLRHNQFVAFVVQNQHLLFPDLIDLADDDLSHLVLIFIVDVVFFQLKDAGGQVLAQRQNRAAPEIFELHLVRHLFAQFEVFVDGFGVAEGNFRILVGQSRILDNRPVSPDFQVPLVDVDDDVEVFIGAVPLDQHVSENVFQHPHEGCPVDIFEFFEFRERFNQIVSFHVSL